jgi:hypothetical protein
MVKRKREWVSEEFANYLCECQRIMKRDLDRDVSKAEITSFIAFMRPTFPQIPAKKLRKHTSSYF